jgi:uridylate kinase
MDDNPHYKRILLKLSGEALKGKNTFGISDSVTKSIIQELSQLHKSGVEIAIVIGGGNYIRGASIEKLGIDRASADYMGMLATIINGIVLQDMLAKEEIPVRLVSALEIKEIAEPFVQKRVIQYLKQGQIVIFTGGTGNPFFTTDTAAALRAIEIKADVFLKGTLVDGVYADDPKKVKGLVKFDHISYDEVIARDLKVMDITAVTLCKEHNIDIRIFNITKKGNIIKSVTVKHMGTSISKRGNT